MNSSSNPAAPGTVVQIFATGDGPLASPAQVYFADTSAQVLFSGDLAPSPGLWQINAVVPPGLSDQVPVFLSTGNLASSAVTLSVH